MTGSRVLKFFSRGVIASGASFRFTTNNAEETAFINACGARGLRVIPSVWFDPAIDFSIAARRTSAATAMRQLVQAHKGNNNILAWGFGDLATSLETTANLGNLRQAYLEAARQAAAEENIPANPASPFGNCRARHPLVMTLGTDDLWGQLRYQPLVAGPTRRVRGNSDLDGTPPRSPLDHFHPSFHGISPSLFSWCIPMALILN
jgi:hypothetical protein